MLREVSWILVVLFGLGTVGLKAEERPIAKSALSTTELANWIDERFADTWRESQITPPPLVDDAIRNTQTQSEESDEESELYEDEEEVA